MMRIYSLFLFALLQSTLYAQVQTPDSSNRNGLNDSLGFVRFLVDQDNGYFEIVIDDTMYIKKYKCALPAGHHKAKIWSPGYIINVVEFDIIAGKTINQYVPMAVSNGRQEFEREYKDYRMAFHRSFTVPLSITLGLALTSVSYMTTAYISKNRVYDGIDLYFSAPTYFEAIELRNSIHENNRKYNLRRVCFYTSLGLTVASLTTTIFTFRKFNKNYTEPELNDPSPFKDKFSLGLSPFGCSIQWRFG